MSEELCSSNAKPQVLAFVRHYLPGYRWGGPIRTLSNMVEHLGDEIDFRIVTSDRDHGDREAYPGTEQAWTRVRKASVHYLPLQAVGLRTVRELVASTSPDIVYLNSYFDPRFSILPLLATRSLGSVRPKVIVAPRGEFSPGALALKRLKKRLFISVSRWSGLYHGVLWHASTDMERADIVREMRPGATAVHVAPNLSAKAGYAHSSDERRPPVDEGILKVCFLSRISPKKHLDYALRTLQRTSNPVEFTIYGPVSDGEYWERCCAIADDMPEHVRVSYAGEVEPDRVPEVLGAHHLFFFPTLGENFGHSILESLAVGTPTLISDQTPWQPRGLGCRVCPLDEPGAFLAALESTASWGRSEFERACADAREHAYRFISDRGVLEANRALFLGGLGGTARKPGTADA